MLTRRDVLKTAAAMSWGQASFGKASQPATEVNFSVPANACDCHTHLFGDPQKFPMSLTRSYTPEPASAEEMAALHKKLHMARVVVVQPSIYGTDNAATLFAIKARGANARGIAVIDNQTPERDLEPMSKAGIRGVRINPGNDPSSNPGPVADRFRGVTNRIKTYNWHVQIVTTLPVIAAIKGLVQDSPVPVVFDHFGGLRAERGLDQPGFADLVELVRSGKAYVKISAAYRSSTQGPDYADMAPYAKALIAANVDRILWGTDWPHPDSLSRPGRKNTDVAPLLQIDDGRILNQLPIWTPDAGVRKKILVDNPARLYGF